MALSCTSHWILVVVGTLLVSQLHAGRSIKHPLSSVVQPNRFGSRLVVDVVGRGVQSFFLRVMVGTGIHTQHSASLHTPPVYIDYIIILSYRLCRVVQTGGETLGGKSVDVAISMV